MLSMETKMRKETDKANLQTGVWLAAHWTFLAAAVCYSLKVSQVPDSQQQQPTSHSQISTFMETSNAAEARVGDLPFLLGLLMVQGHKWSLVIATRDKGSTIMWTQLEFGCTETMQGTYKVFAGLQELAAWSRNVYQPWWQKNVLDGLA
jgi:hypothetical protein